MSYKPILFSTPMVKAILNGRKNMTRRVIKAPVLHRAEPPTTIERENETFRFVWETKSTIGGFTKKPPYDIADILWVRETWQEIRLGNGKRAPYSYLHWYKADDESDNPDDKWRPSIFMPKAYARIFLRITEVRPEQIQDITIPDAICEGCTGEPCGCTNRSVWGCEDCENTGWLYPPTVEFMQLWDNLNAKRGFGWDKNPWVWVYTFARVEKPEGWCS